MKKIVLYFTLLTFSLYSCHTDYKSKIDNALQNGYDELAINYLNKAIEVMEAPSVHRAMELVSKLFSNFMPKAFIPK